MVHQFVLNGYHIVMDTCSGAVHVVDDVAYDAIALFPRVPEETVIRFLTEKYGDRADVTEEEMRRMRSACGYTLDPHTAVATFVARKLGYPKGARALVVAATATPYKFPATCQSAFGEDVLTNPPPSFRDLRTLPIAQTKVVDVAAIDDAVRELF